MDRLIVDASMAIAWVHPGQATPESDLLLEGIGRGTSVIVPALWFAEVSEGLLVLELRQVDGRGAGGGPGVLAIPRL